MPKLKGSNAKCAQYKNMEMKKTEKLLPLGM